MEAGVMCTLVRITCVLAVTAGHSQLVTATSQPHTPTPSQHHHHSTEPDVSEEKRLIGQMLDRYERAGRMGRPVLNVSTPVNVTFGLGLIQMDLNEKEKILTMSMWTRYMWTDEYLRWDPEQYGGVTQIRLQPDVIWIPDIMLFNTADVDVPARTALAVVFFNGIISWFPHCIFRSSCSVDVSNFPFDEQKCNMAFGSWTHNSREVNLDMAFPGGIDLSTFQSDHKESSAWEVLNVTALRKLMPDENEEPNYSVLTFEIMLRRKLVFSTYILTLPCVFLATLTLVIFWLPPERPDRTALGMSTFSSFMVLLLILVEAAPPTANTVPKLGVYYCFNLVIIMLSIILSSLVVNIARGPTDKVTPVPAVPAYITLCILSRLLCLNAAVKAGNVRFAKNKTSSTSAGKSKYTLCCCKVNVKKEEGMNNGHAHQHLLDCCDGGQSRRHRSLCGIDRCDGGQMEFILTDIQGCLGRIEDSVDYKKRTRQEQERVLWQWKCVATVLDRLFFVLYIFLNTLSLVIFFPRPKDM